MFGVFLFALSPLCAEPVETTSFVTCIRPVAKVVAPRNEHAALAGRSTDCREIMIWLRRWEQAARQQTEPTLARRDALRHRVESEMNAHAAVAVKHLTGPLLVTRQRETFAWAIVEHAAGRVCLEATPHDETEQLFYGSIRVWLDETTGRLDELQVTDRRGETRVTWRNVIAAQSSPIRLVSARDETPSPREAGHTHEALVNEPGCANSPLIR